MPKERIYLAKKTLTVETWHRRLGHLNYKSIKILANDSDSGVNTTISEVPECISCAKGKLQPFPCSKRRARRPLELIHSDICGPMETTSIGGSRYFLTFIDDHSLKVFIYFLKEKSQVKESFAEFNSERTTA